MGYNKFIELVRMGKNPNNYDLQKAIKRSYFRALLKICGECLEKLKANKNENSYAIEWLEEKTKNLKKQFENVEKQEYYDAPIEQLNEIELLIKPEGTLAGDRIKDVRLKLIRSALEDSGIPDCFREKVRGRLFEEVCDYFTSELKDNPRVQVIFNSQLLAKISADSEGMKITLEQIIASLQEISKKKYKLEKPIFTIEEYSRLSYIQPLLQYETFIGMGEELRNLHNFLESDKKIIVMSGDGGVGKTKLSLEFAEQVKQKREWNIYYINPDIIVGCDLPPEEKILLILDDASDTEKRDSLIASVSAYLPDDERNLKLLLINRPIYNEAIKSFITQRNIPSTFLTVEKGDIFGFLKEYCDLVDDENAKKIEENCLNSFDFAIFFAEYFREKGEIGKAYDVIKWKAERYIKDIAIMSSLTIVETRETIQLMSLLTPIDLDDIEHIRKLLILKNKDSFENILRIASISDTGILFIDSDDKYVIKPDPLADFLRLELVNNQKFDKIWRRLLPYIPLRISQNIFVLPRYGVTNIEKSAKTLSQMWDELNCKCGKTPEYFSAIIFFTGDLYLTRLVGLNEINLNQWVKCYKEISKYYPDDKTMIENFATSLVNASNHYGHADNWKGMEECLKEIRGLYEKNPDDKTLIENLTTGLFNATSDYGHADNWKGMEKCLKELKGLYEKIPDGKAVIENLAEGIFNAFHHFGRMDNWKGMEECLKEIRGLYEKNSDNKTMIENLAKGIVNATNHYGRTDNWKGMDEYLKELRGLYEKYPDDITVRQKLASSLFNAINHPIKQSYENFILLYKLRFDLSENENKENVHFIEIIFIEETRDEIESKYNKNNKSMTDFVEDLHSVLNDEIEFVILIGRVVENLHINIQKSLYDALDELGL